ncbi:MAG: serine/threonine protein kinase [Myxococcales bacterium]|nr:serine/threonine protein kinase [Myxococcales bacterium]
MKYCNTCGEVYASRTMACSSDGSKLTEWNDSRFGRDDSQICSARDDSQVTSARGDSQVTAVRQLNDEEHTNVDIVPRIGLRAARGKNANSGSSSSDDIGEHTDVIDTKAHETLTDFGSQVERGSDVSKLFCYEDQVADPFAGMVIGNRYLLESKIGTGAFGVVFDAYDKEEEKRVAIKLLSPALCDDKRALIRFRREAIAASRIQHPGIVAIYDFGIQDEGSSYIVMEYLDGRDLATLIEGEQYVSPARATQIIAQCAEALSEAHDAGVLHRDLKPANIFVVQNPDRSEHVKILDFGIAKDRSTNPRNADLTSASKVVGTPYYMAPEQARGLALDGRADVYSLGVILYELLTGTRPFEGASVYEILLAHVGAPRVRPSRVRPPLASESILETIVLKAIDADAEKRFVSMHKFAGALWSTLRVDTEDIAEPTVHASLHDASAANSVMSEVPTGATLNIHTRGKRSPHKRGYLWAAIPLAAALVFITALSSSKDSAEDSPAPDVTPKSEVLPMTASPTAPPPGPITEEESALAEGELADEKRTSPAVTGKVSPSERRSKRRSKRRPKRRSKRRPRATRGRAKRNANTSTKNRNEGIEER